VATVENEDPATQDRYKWQVKDFIPIAFIEKIEEKIKGNDPIQTYCDITTIWDSMLKLCVGLMNTIILGLENGFMLKFEEGTMFFVASSSSEKSEWVKEIKNARQHIGEVNILLVNNS
jgi:hypothetical protein